MPTTNYAGTGGGMYEQRRRGVENRYTQDSATNAYGRFLSQQRGQRGLSDTTKNFNRGYTPLAASYGARGLAGGGVNSGARQQAMANYVGDYYTNYGRQQQDLAQALQGYDLDQSTRDLWRQEELSNIEQERINGMAQTAQNLEALRAWLGSI